MEVHVKLNTLEVILLQGNTKIGSVKCKTLHRALSLWDALTPRPNKGTRQVLVQAGVSGFGHTVTVVTKAINQGLLKP